MTQSYWRLKARPIIRKVLEETAGKPEKDIRRVLRDAYPWGERRMHPYKMWCAEVRYQLQWRLQWPLFGDSRTAPKETN